MGKKRVMSFLMTRFFFAGCEGSSDNGYFVCKDGQARSFQPLAS